MRWERIDLREGLWTLDSEEVKSARKHLVPLAPAAVAILRQTPRLGEFVWTDNGRTHVSGFTRAKSRLDKFIAADGQALSAWRLHDLRRTVATHLVRLRVSEATVESMLNHAPQGVTARTYTLHSYLPEKREALTLWAQDLTRASEVS